MIMRIILSAIFAGMMLSAAGSGTYPLFSEDLSFYQSHDNGAAADLCIGKPNNIWKNGKIVYQKGLRGKALLCGKNGAVLRYFRKGNMNFDQPGTIVFFYKPVNWEQDKVNKWPRLFFWGIESAHGYIGLQGANDPKNLCMCDRPFHLMLLYGKRLPSKVFGLPAPGAKGCTGWHMMAFAWAGEKLFLKFDKTTMKQFDFPNQLTEKDFPADNFSIGSASCWSWLQDEFAIYSRKLSDEELNEIYEATINNKDIEK